MPGKWGKVLVSFPAEYNSVLSSHHFASQHRAGFTQWLVGGSHVTYLHFCIGIRSQASHWGGSTTCTNHFASVGLLPPRSLGKKGLKPGACSSMLQPYQGLMHLQAFREGELKNNWSLISMSY